jgi:hypothetical protein
MKDPELLFWSQRLCSPHSLRDVAGLHIRREYEPRPMTTVTHVCEVEHTRAVTGAIEQTVDTCFPGKLAKPFTKRVHRSTSVCERDHKHRRG